MALYVVNFALSAKIEKEGKSVNMQENYRLIEALESAGWTAQEIVNLIKYVESGEEQYKPKPKAEGKAP